MAGDDLTAQADAIKRKMWTRVANRQAAIALTFHDLVVVATPVDTGNARANWVISVGVPTTDPVSERDAVSTEAQERGLSDVAGYQPGNSRGLKPLWVCNAAAYIVRLNQGSSAQAPAQFVERAIDQACQDVNEQSDDDLRAVFAARATSGEIGDEG